METPHAVQSRTTTGLNAILDRNKRGKHSPSRPRFLTSELNHFRSILAKPFAVTFGRLRVVTRHWSVRHSQECAKGFPCQSVSKFRSAGKVSSKFRQEVINFPHPGIVCILPYPLSSGGRPGGGVSGRPLRDAIRDGGMAQNLAPRRRRTTLDTRQYNTVKIRLVDKYDIVTL